MTHASRAHARLSPSGAERWVNCPGSVRLSEGIASESSIYADEGTAAHMLAEKCLSSGQVTAAPHLGTRIVVREGVSFEVTQEMVDGVNVYLDYVWALERLGFDISIEQRLDLTHVAGGMFGTGDCLAYMDGALNVVDFKYGKGVPVEVERNKQLLLYALGARKRYHNQGVPLVRLTVVQPRALHERGPVRSWDVPIDLLNEMEVELRQAAENTKHADAPLVAGSWCKFCPAAAECPELRRHSLAAAQAEFGVAGDVIPKEPERMSSAELARALSEVKVIEEWCRRVQEYAHQEALQGRMPEGFKFVASKSMRRWRDEAAVARVLPAIFDVPEESLFERKLLSPAKVEALIGKKAAKGIEHMVVKQSSGTLLAPLSDPRPAVRADAASEFEVVE